MEVSGNVLSRQFALHIILWISKHWKPDIIVIDAASAHEPSDPSCCDKYCDLIDQEERRHLECSVANASDSSH